MNPIAVYLWILIVAAGLTNGDDLGPEEVLCASDEVKEKLFASYPETLQKEAQFERSYQAHIEHLGSGIESSAADKTLPVVFHIIHQNGPENLSNTRVLSGLDHLNEAFANINYYDQGTGLETGIQFCIAKQDPDGQPTNGINRVNSSLTVFDLSSEDIMLKNLSRWNPLKYINIWVVEDILLSGQSGVAGYAYFPSSHGLPHDGIVVEAAYTGNSPANTSVLVHEMGHYLGLYHTFEGGCINDNCLIDGDRVCDTPPDATTARPPCDQSINSCNTDANSGFTSDADDMIINYMDYSDLSCYSAFTQGQTDRMHYAVENIRYSLLSSSACDAPCDMPVTASATLSASPQFVGDQITFQNNSVNSLTYNWLVNGTLTSTDADFSYSFDASGHYEIILEAEGDTVICRDDTSWTFDIVCGAKADFRVNSTEIAVGDALLTTNLSENASEYRWIWNGNFVAASTNWSYTATNPGVYELNLIAGNGTCWDTAYSVIVTVVSTGVAKSGNPFWTLIDKSNMSIHTLDWKDPNHEVTPYNDDSRQGFIGQSGVGIDECGNLRFVVAHSGSSQPYQLWIYDEEGNQIAGGNTGVQGLDAVKGGNEINVVPVPQKRDEWYVIYNAHTSDSGWPSGNAQYAPARIFYSRIRYVNKCLSILERDILVSPGNSSIYRYTEGKAISRTVDGDASRRYLYAVRRPENSSTLSLDRFIISKSGILFQSNSGNIPAPWWSWCTHDSPIELSPTEEFCAVVNRNDQSKGVDIVIFNTRTFRSSDAQVISIPELNLKKDGGPNDLSSILSQDIIIESIGNDPSIPLQFTKNIGHRISDVEFSPNGRFLYFTNGGFTGSGYAWLSYLGQIDIQGRYPYDVRLQIQNTPGGTYDPMTGRGCQLSGTCGLNFMHLQQIEAGYDGNLYFNNKSSKLFVVPDPNSFLPQNLIPSNIDLSTPQEKNINVGFELRHIPDNIDGESFFNDLFTSVSFVVENVDCKGDCEYPFSINVTSKDSTVIREIDVKDCPDTIAICIDTTHSYQLSVEGSHSFVGIKVGGRVVYKTGETFDFGNKEGCIELCGNGEDDDNDGLVDCDDPDIQMECCCLEASPIDLGPDTSICHNGVLLLDAGEGFVTYKWQDGWEQQVYTTTGPGIYHVEAIDSCGNKSYDTIVVQKIDFSDVELGKDTSICNGDSILLLLNDNLKYEWYPTDNLSCQSCDTIYIFPDVSTDYIVKGVYSDHCFSFDTLRINVLESLSIYDTLSICGGDTFKYLDSLYFNSGDHVIKLNPSTICDTSIYLHVISDTIVYKRMNFTICPNDSMFLYGNWYVAGAHRLIKESDTSCDTLLTFNVSESKRITIDVEATATCSGDSTGMIELSLAGEDPFRSIWSNGVIDSFKIRDLKSGTYRVSITDRYGCIWIQKVEIDSVIVELPDIVTTDPICNTGLGYVFLKNRDSNFMYFINDSLIDKSQDSFGLSGGEHKIQVRSEEGCFKDSVISLNEQNLFNIEPSVDSIFLNYGDSSDFTWSGLDLNKLIYRWSPCVDLSCCDCPFPNTSSLVDRIYHLLVINQDGCMDSLTRIVVVSLIDDVFIPNVFTPNGDNINDTFRFFLGKGISHLSRLNIYDRWGELVYSEENQVPKGKHQGWDGTFNGRMMNPSVFVYHAIVVRDDGVEVALTGSFTLIN